MLRVRKLLATLGVTLIVLLSAAPLALAQAPGGAGGDGVVTPTEITERIDEIGPNELVLWRVLAAAGTICLAAIGGLVAQSMTARVGLESIARNPAAGGRIFNTMILALALMESLVIYALIIAFIVGP